MHKKRAVIVTAVFLIVIIATIFMVSEFQYRRDNLVLIDALKNMRLDSEYSFNMCSRISDQDMAKDCYLAYLSNEFVKLNEVYKPELINGTDQQKKDTQILVLNDMTEKVDKVCSIDLMSKQDECLSIPKNIENARNKILTE